MNTIEEETKSVIEKLQNYIISESYKGYDPYDVLMSPIFKLPFLKSNKIIRFVSQQVFRRIIYDFRPIMAIKKGINPVTLGLAVQAYTYLKELDEAKSDYYQAQINYCLDKLIEMKSEGYSGICWGYDFDWHGRYANIPAFTPTIVATGIIINGLYEYCKYSKDEKAKELIISSAQFVLNDLNRKYEEDSFCISYSPKDSQLVFNAAMKGARLISQVHSLTLDNICVENAEKIVKFVINNQNKDGSWYYSKGDARSWVDNFHTAYVLDSLYEFINLSGKEEYTEHFEKGMTFYLNNLFTQEYYPKYYSNSLFPIDSTEIAQTIITLTKFNYFQRASIVVDFGYKNLYSNRGYFYYQKYKRFINRNIYMRWSNMYMLTALSFYLFSIEKSKV